MGHDDEFSSREIPLTKTLDTEPALVTSFWQGEDSLLIGSANGCVYKLDLLTEQVEILARVDSIWSLAREGSTIAFGGANGEIYLLNTESIGRLHSASAHDSLVRCLAFLNEYTLISGAKDGTLRTWDIASGSLSLKAEFIGHTGQIRGLKAHSNTVVSGSYDTQVRVWNSLTGECLQTLRGHRGRVHSVEYDGVRIATSSEDRDIRVWDRNTGSCTAILEGYGAQGVRIALLHLASDMLIAGGADGSIRSWCLTSMDSEPRELSVADGDGISALKVDGGLIVSGSSTGVLRVIDRYSGATVANWRVEGETIAVFQVAFTAGHGPVVVYRKDESILVTIL